MAASPPAACVARSSNRDAKRGELASDTTMNKDAAAPVLDGLPPERRIWAMAAVLVSVSMSSLDTSISNIALPTIASQLNVSPASVVWVVNAYQIAMVTTLLPLAALSEIVGSERLYIGGLMIYVAGAFMAAMSDSLPMLIAARTLQGLGASGMMSVNSALIRFIFPRSILGRGIGMNAMAVGTSITVGPTVGALILSVADWPWLFAINIPVGLASIVLAIRTLPRTPRASHAFDFFGALLTAACLGPFIFGISSAARQAAWELIALYVFVTVLAGTILLRRQRGHPAPMLPVDLFRIPVFSLSVGTAICSFATQGIAFVSLPFLFENAFGLSTVATGFLMTPWPVVVAIMAPIAGRLSDSYPAGLLGGIGLAMLGLGMALLAMLPANPSVYDIAWRMMICGCGFGFFQAPNMNALMSSTPAARSGSASGMVATARMTGQTIGAAIAALCFTIAGNGGPMLALALRNGGPTPRRLRSFLRLAVGGRGGGRRVSSAATNDSTGGQS